jgi:hypothetical protein
VRPSPTTTEQNAAASAGAERAPGGHNLASREAEMEILIRACGGPGPGQERYPHPVHRGVFGRLRSLSHGLPNQREKSTATLTQISACGIRALSTPQS